nr:ATPase subunit 9, mitochondrial [Tanacetum cinerariifolium]
MRDAVGGWEWVDMMVLYCKRSAADECEFARRINELLQEMVLVYDEKVDFIRELEKKRKENYQLEMLEGAKLIGAGAATIASAGAAIGIGNVLSSSIHSVARNPSLAKQSFGYAILGFALTEAIASFT